MKHLLLLTMIATTACARATIPHAFRAVGFTDNEVTILNNAANEWRTASNDKYNLLIVDKDSCDENTCSTIRIVDKLEERAYVAGITVQNDDSDIEYSAGITYSKTDHDGVRVENDQVNGDAELYDIQIRNMRVNQLTCAWGDNDGWEQVLFRVSMHELGHSLGKRHIKEPWHVMSPYCSTDPNTLTEEDLTE